MDVVRIHTPFIRLDQALKLVNAVGSGAEAKRFIQEGLVFVNGEVCTMRGKKLISGDCVFFDDYSWKVKIEE